MQARSVTCLFPAFRCRPSKRGKPGALEEIVGGEGIQFHWQSIWSRDSTTLPIDATATQIFDHALENNPLARAVLGLASRTLAYAIYNMSLVLNCPLFVLGGSVGLHPALGDARGPFSRSKTPACSPGHSQFAVFRGADYRRHLPRYSDRGGLFNKRLVPFQPFHASFAGQLHWPCQYRLNPAYSAGRFARIVRRSSSRSTVPSFL